MSTFTGIPRADRFRLQDVWRGPDGNGYRVCKGVASGAVTLRPAPPIRPSSQRAIHLRHDSVAGFQRLEWGGQP